MPGQRVFIIRVAHPDDPDPRKGSGWVVKEIDWPGPIPRAGELVVVDPENPGLSPVFCVAYDGDGTPILVFTTWLNNVTRGFYERRGYSYHAQEWTTSLPPLTNEHIRRVKRELRGTDGLFWRIRVRRADRRGDRALARVRADFDASTGDGSAD
jgi:hypothetical protein